MRKLVPVWCIPVVLAFAIGTVWLRLSAVRTTYAISKADRLVAQLRDETERAELRLATLRSPKRLERLAKTRYRLAPPRTDQVIRVQ